jgi:hypothetical protein
MKEIPEERQQQFSRVLVALYAVMAAVNVLSFLLLTHDMNKLAIAVLLGALIGNQKAVDAWRESAKMWRENAENYRGW